MSTPILAFDLTTYKIDGRRSTQIIQSRTAKTTPEGSVNNTTLEIEVGQTVSLDTFVQVSAISLVSTGLVDLVGRFNGANETVITDVTIFVLDSRFENIKITNKENRKIRVQIATISNTVSMPTPLPQNQIFFQSVFEQPLGIAPIGQPVQNFSSLIITNMALVPMVIDQITPQQPGVGIDKIRVCDVDGTPNINGSYLMLLDTNLVNSILVSGQFYVSINIGA